MGKHHDNADEDSGTFAGELPPEEVERIEQDKAQER